MPSHFHEARNCENRDSQSQDGKTLAEDTATQCCELSIVVCTHNRPRGVEELIGILQPQIAGHAIELIVVDSASSSEAALRLREMTIGVSQCKLIRLDSPGVSAARNAGLYGAAAAWIAYIDDDEIPPADWVFRLRRLIERLPADCAACGGNVLPVLPAGTTCKMTPRWLDYLSTIDRAGEFDQTASPRFGIGHSVVRASALKGVGGFDPRLGRDGCTLLSGEEVLLLAQLNARGWKIWHSGRIEVGHKIPAERLQRRWVLERAFWEGVTAVRVLSIQSPEELPRLAIRAAVKRPVLAAAAAIVRRFLDADLRLAFTQGVAEALRQQRRSERKKAAAPRHLAASRRNGSRGAAQVLD